LGRARAWLNLCPSPPPPGRREVWPWPQQEGALRAGRRPAQTLLCPFTVSQSEAALTRTSAIRLPPGLGPETGVGEGRGRGRWERRVPGDGGEGREPGSWDGGVT
jgi:hypothetical protein